MESIHELSTGELHALAVEAEGCGEELPPLDAVENEDWGRDYLLQRLGEQPPEWFAARGLTWEPA